MNPDELKDRTKKFGLRVIKLYEEISSTKVGQIALIADFEFRIADYRQSE